MTCEHLDVHAPGDPAPGTVTAGPWGRTPVLVRVVVPMLMLLMRTPLGAMEAPAMPHALPPWQVGIDSLECGVHIDCSRSQPQLLRPEDRIVLSLTLPVQGALLHLSQLRIARCRTDHGEWLAVLVRSTQADQAFTADSPANRDRQLHLPLDLSPPFTACGAIMGLHGSLRVTMAHGALRQELLPARIGASVACDGLGPARIEDRSARGWQLVLPLVVATQLSALVAVDAAGLELPTHLRPLGTDPTQGSTTEVQCDLPQCATIRLSWWPSVESRDIAIDIPEIDIPGGLPAIGALDAAAGPPAPVAAPIMQLQDPLNLAVARRDLPLVTELVAHSGALDLEDRDHRVALTRAAALGDAALVAVMLAHHALPQAHGLDGWNALHAAVAAGSTAVVAQLLAAGADPLLQLPDGRSSIDVARDFARWRILSMLLGNPGPE